MSTQTIHIGGRADPTSKIYDVKTPARANPTMPSGLEHDIQKMKESPFKKTIGTVIPVTILVTPPPAQTEWNYILATANNGLTIKAVSMLVQLVATDKIGFHIVDDQKNKIFRTSQATIVAAGPVTYACILYTGWNAAPAIQADNTIFFPLPDVHMRANWRIQSAGTYTDAGDIFSNIVIYGEL